MIIYSPRILAGYFLDNSLEYTVEELDEVEKQIQDSKTSRKKKYSKKKKERYTVPQAAFDPNEYVLSDWVKIGLSEKQANVVIRFTQHGIYSNEELKKIFVISDDLFGLIKDSTFYPAKPQKNSAFSQTVSRRSEKIVQLNLATHDELIELNGIGDYYAKKIIEYREKLGGFHSQEQLLELWKFTPEKLAKIKDQLLVSGDLQKININEVSYEELVKHPYVSSKVANSIVKMRSQRDGYKNLEDVLDSKLIDRELFNKLEPYIKL